MCYNKAQVVRFTELTQLRWVGVLSMKILCIGVTGLPSGVGSDLSTAKVFQDYDAVVVNPKNFITLYRKLYRDMPLGFSDRADGATVLQETVWDIITSINKRRIKELDGLFELGGILICFVQPLIKGFYYYQTRMQTRMHRTSAEITNYDWLDPTVAFEKYDLELGFGETIDSIDQGHPFAAYLEKKPSWTTFWRLKDCSEWRVIAGAFGTNAVALARRQGRGHVVFLPSEYSVEDGALLESCIVNLLGQKEPREKPTWVREIFVLQQEQINHMDDKIEKLRERKEKLHTSNEQLERWKWLIWETGKEYLEPVVREALGLIGCKVEPQPDKDSDGKVDSDFGTALLEVGGGEGTIKRDKLGQLVSNIGNFLSKKEILPKGIVVGNPFRKERLDNRPPKGTQKKLFAKELIEDAEKQNITVLLSTDLYCVVCGILNGQVGEDKKKELRHLIFMGKGLVRLSL